jgi:hypothetical protein
MLAKISSCATTVRRFSTLALAASLLLLAQVSHSQTAQVPAATAASSPSQYTLTLTGPTISGSQVFSIAQSPGCVWGEGTDGQAGSANNTIDIHACIVPTSLITAVNTPPPPPIPVWYPTPISQTNYVTAMPVGTVFRLGAPVCRAGSLGWIVFTSTATTPKLPFWVNALTTVNPCPDVVMGIQIQETAAPQTISYRVGEGTPVLAVTVPPS